MAESGGSRAATTLVSNFNTHHNGWTVLSGSWEHRNGTVFRTEGVAGASSSIVRVGKFDDFIYEVRMKREGCTYCANRLVVRSRVDQSSEFDFAPCFFFQYTIEGLNQDGMFSVWKVKPDGTSVLVKGWTSTVAVNKWGWNVLKVEAAGDFFYFYINGTIVWEGSRSGLGTGRVGIGMYTDASSTGNDFRVDWARLTPAVSAVPASLRPAPAGVEVAGGDVDRSPGE